eukprot:TRINITY_DN50552_c0_g1_i1.p1 TRINITY_DN50552_c0_g1~~TRINITY_DN50552_c0_g1_i1.p1  ORF type:complete len:626 (-),score=90.02 TRINITY_DN50552_c0_g1_i1:107-1984(-)
MSDGSRASSRSSSCETVETYEAMFEILDKGTGGIAEMAKRMNDRTVQWGLVGIELGDGTLTRYHSIFISMLGENCSPVKRGRLSSLTEHAIQMCREVVDMADGIHDHVEVHEVAEVTESNIRSHLRTTVDTAEYSIEHKKKKFSLVSEEHNSRANRPEPIHDSKQNISEAVSSKAKKVEMQTKSDEESEEWSPRNEVHLEPPIAPAADISADQPPVDQAVRQPPQGGELSPESSAERKHVSGQGKRDIGPEDPRKIGRRIPEFLYDKFHTSGRDALAAVSEKDGAWNWVLIRPDPKELTTVAGGTGSVEEMREYLQQNKAHVFFGLLRLSFGRGRMQRTYHVFIDYFGAAANRVSATKDHATKSDVKKAFDDSSMIAHSSFELQVREPEDLILETIFDRLIRSCIVDFEFVEHDHDFKKVICEETLRDALLEHQELMAKLIEDTEQKTQPLARQEEGNESNPKSSGEPLEPSDSLSAQTSSRISEEPTIAKPPTEETEVTAQQPLQASRSISRLSVRRSRLGSSHCVRGFEGHGARVEVNTRTSELSECLRLVHSEHSEVDWIVFGAKEGWAKQRVLRSRASSGDCLRSRTSSGDVPITQFSALGPTFSGPAGGYISAALRSPRK